jgi:exodeoxyribonuclease VII small subunit
LAAKPAAAYNSFYMAKKADGAAPSFEQGLKELESIVKELEQGELPLEKSLELFEKGVQLSEACRKQLQEAETKVEILLRKEGKLEATPFQLQDGEGDA